MKKTLALLVLAGASFLGSSCNSLGKSEIVVANVENPVFYRVSREEGEKQLISLTKTAKNEDGWIFRERYPYDKKSGVWIDVVNQKIGDGLENEKSIIIPNNDEVNVGALEKLIQKKDIITFYHIHILYSDIPDNWALFCEVPSIQDWVTHASFKDFCSKRGASLNPSVVIGGKYKYTIDFSGNKEPLFVRQQLEEIYEKYFSVLNNPQFELFEEFRREISKFNYDLTYKRNIDDIKKK